MAQIQVPEMPPPFIVPVGPRSNGFLLLLTSGLLLHSLLGFYLCHYVLPDAFCINSFCIKELI